MDSQTESEPASQPGKQTDGRTDSSPASKTDRQPTRQPDRQTDRQFASQPDWQLTSDRQANPQTGRQTDICLSPFSSFLYGFTQNARCSLRETNECLKVSVAGPVCQSTEHIRCYQVLATLHFHQLHTTTHQLTTSSDAEVLPQYVVNYMFFKITVRFTQLGLLDMRITCTNI